MPSHIQKRRKLDHGSPSEPDSSQEIGVSSQSNNNSANQNPTSTNRSAHSSHHAISQPQARSIADSATNFSAEAYKSNMFKLQTDELLAEVRPHLTDRMLPVDNALRKIKAIIENIPDSDSMIFTEAAAKFQKLDKIHIPFPEPKSASDIKYRMEYSRPSAINVVGSYVLKTMTKNNDLLTVDLAVAMPTKIFQEKDYLNYRYFQKRAFYLAYLAKGIHEAKECHFKLTFDYLHGNPLQPVLIVESSEGVGDYDFSKSKARIQIIPTISEDAFKKSKTHPQKNCIRQNLYLSQSENAPSAPTPIYNASLRADCSVLSYNKFLHNASAFSDSYVDCCVLGKIWLGRRGFGSGVHDGGFGSFEWATLCAMLLFGGGHKGHTVLSPGYSSYQFFKAILQFLVSRDLTQQPLNFETENVQLPKSDVPIIFDGPRGLNILFKMSPSSYQRLRFEARVSLQMLNDSSFDHFEPVFIQKTNDPLQAFDIVAKIPIPPNAIATAALPEAAFSGSQGLSATLFNVLKRGLGDRAKLISVWHAAPGPWALKSNPPNFNGSLEFSVGFLLNPSNANRNVDQGPSAEEKKEASAFRNFWGPKAELRRFRDGRIVETLVWTTSKEGIPIFQQIVSWVLSRHFGEAVSVPTRFMGNDFKKLYTEFGIDDPSSQQGFQKLDSAFKTLERDIRNIEGLPLHVRQLSASDAQLRYTSVNYPSAESLKVQEKPADVVLQFEGSARWPDDLVAIQQTKIAFLLKLGEGLQGLERGIVVRLGLENEQYSRMNMSFLDIVYPSRHSFRLRIHNEREQFLLEEQIKDRSIDPRSRDEAVKALSAYKRMFLQSPLHTQTFISLCTRLPLLGPTIRLVKVWFDVHLLSTHFEPELIELVVARVFLQPYPWQTPSSLATGFLRALTLISRSDWRSEPLIVDLSSESTGMTPQDVEAIRDRFQLWRKMDPAMHRVVWFAASNLDPEGIVWSEANPSKVAATRLTALARSACLAVKSAGLHLDPTTIFSTSLAEYDFVVHLNQRILKNIRDNKRSISKFKNVEVQLAGDSNQQDCDPVHEFLNELEGCYSNSVVFFNDVINHSTIAGLWIPSTGPRPWKVGMTYSSRPCSKTDLGGCQISINKSGILHEIGRLGGELILDIESKH